MNDLWMRRFVPAIVLAAALLGPASPAAAACPSPSATPDPMMSPTTTPGTVSLTGGGWGHGLGMSQYAAWGGASLGCTHTELLRGFYPTTSVTSRTSPDLQVGLLFSGSSARTSSTLTNEGTQAVTWVHGGSQVWTLRPGETVRASVVSGPRLRLSGGGATWTQPTTGDATVTATLSPARVVTIDGKSARGHDIPYNRGRMQLVLGETAAGTFEHVVDIGMEEYLLGLNEMPFSWPIEALKAQAVAGRSFATAAAGSWRTRCGSCTLYDSVNDQFWSSGLEEVHEPTWYARWSQAVGETANRVIVTAAGNVATAYYSSSHGGGSQSLGEAWDSPDVDYVSGQNLARWAQAVADRNGRHRWRRNLDAGAVAEEFDLELLRAVDVTRTTATGRADTIRVEGWAADGTLRSAELTREDDMRARFGLLSSNVKARFARPRMQRHDGTDRFHTAALASRSGWPGGSDVAVVARSDDPTDALGGVALAGALDAPLLLTHSTRLADATRDELNRLGATRVVLLGGPAAVDDEVAARITATTGVTTVDRVAGANRFETMRSVAARLGSADTAFVVRATSSARGSGWADALAVSGVAATRAAAGAPSPVLGVGARGIPSATRNAIRERGIDRVVVVGGEAVVSGAQADALRDLGVTVTRWAGGTRYGTSQQVAEREPGTGNDVIITTGTNFPDALAAGALAARTDGTLLLVPKSFDRSRSPWRDHEHPAVLGSLGATADRAVAMGGRVAVGSRELVATAWYMTDGAGRAGTVTAIDKVEQEAVLDVAQGLVRPNGVGGIGSPQTPATD